MVLSVASVVILGLATNPFAAATLAFSIAFYVFVYTVWLKRRTPQNIVIGGAAGAFPPIVGWASVTGDVTLEPLVLFAIIFIWTPPHFWALSLWAHADYEKAGVPMLPVVSGARATRLQILLYTLAARAARPRALGAGLRRPGLRGRRRRCSASASSGMPGSCGGSRRTRSAAASCAMPRPSGPSAIRCSTSRASSPRCRSTG